MAQAIARTAGTARRASAVVCRGGAHTELDAVALDRPAGGEMVLATRVVGLCGTDLFKLANGLCAPGTVLGHELVGEVIEAGPGCVHRPGSRVVVPHHVACGECELCRRGSDTMCATFRENLLAPGGFATHVLVRSRAADAAAREVPDALADEAAVFMEPAACVLRGIERAGVGPEPVAVVLGGGSMGLLHLLVLRAACPGAAVAVVEPLAERRELALELGAAAAIAPGSGLARRVAELGCGHGADAVFDTVGGAGPLELAIPCTRPGGSVVLFAHAGAGERAGFVLNELFREERRVVATYSAGLAEQRAVFDLLVSGRLDPTPLVTHRLDLADFDRGVELTQARRALKVLYTPGSGAPGAGVR